MLTSASAKTFFTACSGVPPKIKTETGTPVSKTILFLFFVSLSPDCFYRIVKSFIVNLTTLNAFFATLNAASSRTSGERTDRI
jgi:hypothetical protein